MPIRTASPSTSTSGGPPPPWPSPSRSSATASPSTAFAPTADPPSTSRPSNPSGNASAPADEPGSTSSKPAGYTRLGAGIRGAGEILKTEAGTPNRLLLVLSDGFPYDDGYEARYAEADAHKALEELRADGVACLCLSIGASTPTDALHRVFGSASHANAPTLADLSPRMDELFLAALKELAAPNPRGARSKLDAL